MTATIKISVPDNLIHALAGTPDELPRRTLEALVLTSYRAGRLSHAQAAEALNLSRWETDAFLKENQSFRTWEPQEFSADLDYLRSIAKK